MNRLLVNCKDYNGHKDVLFMMREDDFRLNPGHRINKNLPAKVVKNMQGNYDVLGEGEYTHKKRELVIGKKTYRVFPDWSVKEITSGKAS